MPRRSVPCRICGQPCTVGTGSAGLPAHNRCRAPQSPQRPCSLCGQIFQPRKRKKRDGGGYTVTCSPDCGVILGSSRAAAQRSANAVGPIPRTCGVCQQVFASRDYRARFCSRTCRDEWQQTSRTLKWPSSRIWVRDCDECGAVFVARHGRTRLCSDECRRLRNISQVLDRHYGYVYNAMREGPLLDYLLERDRRRCGICHKPVRAKSGERGPSIDHIQPRSRGGSDELVNLQLAHLFCNRSKNNRGGGEQLLLVG